MRRRVIGLYYLARAPEICNAPVYFRNKLKVVLGKVIEVHFYGDRTCAGLSVGESAMREQKKRNSFSVGRHRIK